MGVHLTDVLAAVKVSDDCAAIPVARSSDNSFQRFLAENSTALSPEAIECIAEIINNIQQLGIESYGRRTGSFYKGKYPKISEAAQ